MSLVAYGSSDDSDASDTEESSRATSVTAILEKTETAPSVNNSQDSHVQGIKDEDSGEISDSDEEDSKQAADAGNKHVDDDDLFKRLPTPRGQSGGIIDETDELEEEVKPKPSQVADAPTPPATKSRKPVKITIPALPDSDEDEGPSQKKPKLAPSKGTGGLFSMLPAPVHAPKKEANRILIPYSLSKKPKAPTAASSTEASSTSGVAKSRPSNDSSVTKPLAGLTGYEDSDSDDNDAGSESVNFFSLGSDPSKPKPVTSSSVNAASSKPATNMQTVSEPVSGVPTVPLPPVSQRTSLSLPAPVNAEKPGASVLRNEPQVSTPEADASDGLVFGQPVNQDAPLTFKGGLTSRVHTNMNQYPASQTSSSDTGDGTETTSQNMYYNVPYDGQSQYPEVSDDQALQYDQEFLKLQGKKQRGKEEINIVDVNADDFTAPEDVAKYMSEEQSYQSHSKKDGNQPTAQQKRKHQIQYLAFQAKEMELELKNQWSQNRMTKKQTQAKYGF